MNTNQPSTLPRIDPLNELMGIRAVSIRRGEISLTQEVGERFLDHRGRSGLGSIGVMIDAALGGAVHSALDTAQPSVIAQISISAGENIQPNGSVAAFGHLEHLGDGTGLASGRLQDGAGTLLAVMTGRAMIVSRPSTTGPDGAPIREPLAPSAPEKLSDLTGLTGREIIDGIRTRTLERGPLAGLLDLQIAEVDEGSLRADCAAAPWMANSLGSIQGGVLLSIVDAVTGLTAQTLTTAVQDYRILDHKIDYLRSPDIGGPSLRVEADVIRAGRRLALIESRAVDAVGQVYVRATSSIAMLVRA